MTVVDACAGPSCPEKLESKNPGGIPNVAAELPLSTASSLPGSCAATGVASWQYSRTCTWRSRRQIGVGSPFASQPPLWTGGLGDQPYSGTIAALARRSRGLRDFASMRRAPHFLWSLSMSSTVKSLSTWSRTQKTYRRILGGGLAQQWEHWWSWRPWSCVRLGTGQTAPRSQKRRQCLCTTVRLGMNTRCGPSTLSGWLWRSCWPMSHGRRSQKRLTLRPWSTHARMLTRCWNRSQESSGRLLWRKPSCRLVSSCQRPSSSKQLPRERRPRPRATYLRCQHPWMGRCWAPSWRTVREKLIHGVVAHGSPGPCNASTPTPDTCKGSALAPGPYTRGEPCGPAMQTLGSSLCSGGSHLQKPSLLAHLQNLQGSQRCLVKYLDSLAQVHSSSQVQIFKDLFTNSHNKPVSIFHRSQQPLLASAPHPQDHWGSATMWIHESGVAALFHSSDLSQTTQVWQLSPSSSENRAELKRSDTPNVLKLLKLLQKSSQASKTFF